MNNPLGEHSELGRWIFVHDYDDDRGGGFVTGEFLLRSDGQAFMRMGIASGSSIQTWRFVTDWSEVARWSTTTDIATAVRGFKYRGYSIDSRRSNVAIDADQGEPFASDGSHPVYL